MPIETPPPWSPWSDIPVELAGLVLGRLPALVDRVRFAAVCPRWRTAAREIPPPTQPLPLLMLPDGTAYSLPCREPLRFPACAGYAGACGNWLLFSNNGVCFLRDPLTNADMPLPALSQFQCRLTSGRPRPCLYNRITVTRLFLCPKSRLVVASVKLGEMCGSRIAVCKSGGSWWSVCMDAWPIWFADMAFHEGKLFAVQYGINDNDLYAIDISVDQSTGHPWISGIRQVIISPPDYPPLIRQGWPEDMKMSYLVDSGGALLMVRRRNHLRLNDASMISPFHKFVGTGCNTFEVFKADLEKSQWTRVTTIGDDQLLFLSGRQSRLFCISQFRIAGDLIVFFENDDDQNINWYDMKSPCSFTAYDMRDGKVSKPLPGVSWDRAAVHAAWLFPQN